MPQQSVPHPVTTCRPATRPPRPSRSGRVSGAVRMAAAAALAAGLLAAVPTSAQADLRNPRPVGKAPSAAPPTMSRTVSAQAIASVTCDQAEAFSRTAGGALYRLVDSNPAGAAADTMKEQGQVGSGWSGGAFAWMASGGDGVLYGLLWNGDLRWYRYNSGSKGWMNGSGTKIGSGFTPRSKIINIALSGDGSFYVVRANRQLAIYRHTGRLSGTATWANGAGWTIGSGWTANEILSPNGDGTIYRQYAGRLYWYRHTDPASGRVTWSGRKTIGSGWRFYDVLSAGGGVLYATQGSSGDVLVYRHGDPVGGSNAWAASRGVHKGVVRPDSYGIALDPAACRLS